MIPKKNQTWSRLPAALPLISSALTVISSDNIHPITAWYFWKSHQSHPSFLPGKHIHFGFCGLGFLKLGSLRTVLWSIVSHELECLPEKNLDDFRWLRGFPIKWSLPKSWAVFSKSSKSDSQIILKPMVLEFPHDLGNLQMGYYLVMTNSSPWKIHPFLKTVNHLFLWAIYTMA